MSPYDKYHRKLIQSDNRLQSTATTGGDDAKIESPYQSITDVMTRILARAVFKRVDVDCGSDDDGGTCVKVS